MSSLLPVYRDRPAFVPHNGGRIYISVHDAEYLRQRAEWKRKLAEAHPDRPSGDPHTFRRLIKQRDKWEDAEVEWYAQYGMLPPGNTDVLPGPRRDFLALADHKPTTQVRVAAYLEQYPEASDREIADELDMKLATVRVARCRIRQGQPTKKATQATTKSGRLFRLLADGRPHPRRECLDVIQAKHGNEFIRAVKVLQARGFDVVSVKRIGSQGIAYQLLGVKR